MQGHLLKKTEAKGSSAERTTTYSWDIGHNRLVGETIDGLYSDTLTYNDDGRVLTRRRTDLTSFGQGNTQLTTYTYTKHPNGLLASVVADGPIPGTGDATTVTFSEGGDILTVTDGAGLQTAYSDYTALGLPGQIRSPNGDIVQFDYDARGRELKRRVIRDGSAALTTTSYDGAENVASVQSPDGVKRIYQYDAARRLVAVDRVRSDGTTVHEQIDYNSASQVAHRKIFDSAYPQTGRVNGLVGRVKLGGDGHYYVTGWTCEVGSATSLTVDVYLVSVGKIAAGVRANEATDADVAQMCQSTGRAYGFSVEIPAALGEKALGKGVDVYGFSPKGYDSKLLERSGAIKVPTNQWISEFAGLVHDAEWNYSIAGWVCAQSLTDAVAVELWIGAGPGQGRLLATVTANGDGDGDKRAQCDSDVRGRSFRYQLSPYERTVYSGQSVYAVAKSPGGAMHDLNLGAATTQRVIPAMDRFVQWQRWEIETTDPSEDSRTLKLTVRNTGNVMWGATKDAGHVFLHVGPTERFIGGPSSMDFELPHPVAPGEDVSFEWSEQLINVRSTYDYSAQMRVDRLGFGDIISHSFHLPATFHSRCPTCQQP